MLNGEVEDDRDDDGEWPEGLWAASASGATIEEAQAAAIAEYEDALHDENEAAIAWADKYLAAQR